MIKKYIPILEKALDKTVKFEGENITNRQKIDLLIKRGFITKEIVHRNNSPDAYTLSKGTKKFSFPANAEKLYIDKLLNSKSIKEAQNLKQGAVLEGPDHAHGGIDIVVNKKVVANAQGEEIVINAEASRLNCEQLSEINQSAGNGVAFSCENTMKYGGKLSPEGTEVKIFIFDKKKFSSIELNSWIIENNINSRHIDKRSNNYRVRNDTPFEFDPASLKTINIANGINAIIGYPLVLNSDAEKVETKIGKTDCGCHHHEEIPTAAKGAVIKEATKGTKAPSAKTIHAEQYSINKLIEALIDQKGINPDNYTSDEKNYLRQYSGYGGLDVDEMTLEQAQASFTEFYTPDLIVQKMWALAYKYGFQDGQSILEPAVGTGQFLKYVPEKSTATGYEINKYSYSICKILYPQFTFFHQPFEDIFIKNRDSIKSKIAELQKYDLVMSNPPYGILGGLGMGMGEKQYTKAGNWIEYFLLRGLDLTNPNGLLIYIIGTEVANGGIPFLQQGPSKIKEMIADRADLIDAYRLPNGVFERTDVLSDILVFKRK